MWWWNPSSVALSVEARLKVVSAKFSSVLIGSVMRLIQHRSYVGTDCRISNSRSLRPRKQVDCLIGSSKNVWLWRELHLFDQHSKHMRWEKERHLSRQQMSEIMYLIVARRIPPTLTHISMEQM